MYLIGPANMATNDCISERQTMFDPVFLRSMRILSYLFQADVLRSLANERIKTGKDVSILPVVKNEKSGLDTGILNERQKIWTSSKPNQGDVENPVLVK